MTECVKGSDTSTEKGSCFSRVKLFGNGKNCFGTKSNVFSVSTILGDTVVTQSAGSILLKSLQYKPINSLRRASNKVVLLARAAVVAVSSVPARANTVSNFETCLAGGYGDDVTDYFVASDPRKGNHSPLDHAIAAVMSGKLPASRKVKRKDMPSTDTTGEDFDENSTCFRGL